MAERYENGEKSKEFYIKNGKLEGRFLEWHENGQKWKEGKYKNGTLEGHWTVWNEDGSIDNEKSGIFKAGKWIAFQS